MITKQKKQIHALFALALTMYPMRIDENIHLQLQEKYGDKMLHVQKGDPEVYEKLFSYACPKILSPVVLNYDNVHPNCPKETFLQQLKAFSDKVQLQAHTPPSTASQALQHHAHGQAGWHPGHQRAEVLCVSALDVQFQSALEVDFCIDKNMIHIADTKMTKCFGISLSGISTNLEYLIKA
ncbi:hypothetical protein NN561_017337 [Cricetulus griseus]